MTQENSNLLALQDEKKKCRYCETLIPITASVCYQCKLNQKRCLNHFRIDYISQLIALVMMLIAYQQLQEVRQERIAAKAAMEKAQLAEKTAKNLSTDLTIMQADMISVVDAARKASLELKHINEISLSAKADIDHVKKMIKNSEREFVKIKSIADFNFIVTKARNDDRESFIHLVELARMPGEYKQLATEIIYQIQYEFKKPYGGIKNPPVEWIGFDVDPDKSSMAELKAAYSTLNPVWKPSFIKKIWALERFSKSERLDFLCEIIRDDKSLFAIQTAIYYMGKETNMGDFIFFPNQYINRCNRNKSQHNK